MKPYIFPLLFGLLFLASCHKEKPVPECIQSMIIAFSNNSLICEGGANVRQYTFQEQTVFVFDMGSCGADLTSDVVDSDCNLLGRLGGFLGNTIINGETFSNAQYIRTVWSR